MKSAVLLNSYLKALRLPTFLREYQKVAQVSAEAGHGYPEFLEQLAGLELADRETRAVARRIRLAGFPAEKELADFDFAAVPSVNQKRILDLFRCEFLDEKASVVLLGPPGVGKTHLAVALGREACRQGKKVRFYTAAGLANLYNEARDQREILRLEAQIRRCDLIVVDELGYLPFTKTGAENLFGFFSQCYEQVSLVVTTNLPFAEWPQIFGGDERLTGALLDRLTHRVHIIEVKGNSYRLKKSLERKKRTKK